MIVRRLVIGSLLLATMPWAPSSASAATHRLVVSGTGLVYSDITVRQRTTLSWDNFETPHDAMTATFTGDYAGVVVQSGDAQHEVLGGAVLVRGRRVRMDGGYLDPVSVVDPVGTSLTLPPGRYRILLVSDGRAVVRMRMSAGRAMRVTATRRASGVAARRYGLADLLPVDPVAAGTTRVPFVLNPRGLAVGSFFTSPGDDAPTYAALCVRRPTPVEYPCENGWYVHPGRSITASVEGRRHGNGGDPDDWVFDFTQGIAGPTVREGNAFVLVFDDAI